MKNEKKNTSFSPTLVFFLSNNELRKVLDE